MVPPNLPPIMIPFPNAESPYTAMLQQHAIEWVQRYHLVQRSHAFKRFQAGKFWLLVSCCFPHGDGDMLTVVAKWDAWAFMLDDQSDESQLREQPQRLQALLDDLFAVFHGEKRQASPLFDSLEDVWRHMVARSDGAWQDRFRQSVAETFAGLVWEATNRAQGITPSLATYIAHRRATSGFATHMDLADYTDNVRLPPAIRLHPQVREITDCANNVISWTNDLFSLDKELQAQEQHNIVVIIQHEKQVTHDVAAEAVASMVNQEVQRFIDLEEQLPTFGDPIDDHLRRYVGVLKSWMRGNMEWSQRTGRYVLVQQDTGASYLEPLWDRQPSPAYRPAPRAWLPILLGLLLTLVVGIALLNRYARSRADDA